MKSISVELSDELDQILTRIAEEKRQSKTRIIVQAIEGFLRERNSQPSFYELSKDLAGAFDGPEDLATNPEHLRGFGRK